MTPSDILEKWIKYSKYDPDEHSFNIMSAHYAMNRICKEVASIMEMDTQGLFSLLYIKTKFEKFCSSVKVTLTDVLNKTDGLDDDDWEMWRLLHSDVVSDAEKSIISLVHSIEQQHTTHKAIGETDIEQERAILADAIIAAVEELKHCHLEIYVKGGQIQPIEKFNLNIRKFNTLVECLHAIENSPDAAYVCYISCYDTPDGYFGYFIKNNGNIFSINDRVNEMFPKQHQASRGGRWREAKKMRLFPYYVLENVDSETDQCDDAKTSEHDISLFDMEPDAYLPLVIGMIMINAKMSLTDFSDKQTVVIDSLLPTNIAGTIEASTSLTTLENSAIAVNSAKYEVPFSSEDIISAAPADSMDITTADAQIFVNLYGEGFQLKTQNLLNRQLLLSNDHEDATYVPEFVATKEHLDRVAYMQGRQQLADYIREQRLKEFRETGGTETIAQWWNAALIQSKDKIFDMCIEKWKLFQSNAPHARTTPEWIPQYGTPYRYIYVGHDFTGGHVPYAYSPYGSVTPFNKKIFKENKLLCPITGAAVSYVFLFRPNDWTEIQEILSDEVSLIKPVVGYRRNGRPYSGNSILDITDPIARMGTIFEKGEHPGEMKDVVHIGLSFCVAFSKSGWKKLLRERNVG